LLAILFWMGKVVPMPTRTALQILKRALAVLLGNASAEVKVRVAIEAIKQAIAKLEIKRHK
jgi:hypothetical protein